MLVNAERFALSTPMRIAPRVALSIDGLLAGGFLSACSPAAMGPVTVFANPGKYEYYSCGSSLVSAAPVRLENWR